MLAAMIAVSVGGCGAEGPGTVATSRPPTPVTTARLAPFESPAASFPPYRPSAEEPYANGKRIAGRAAQALLTFGPGATIAAITDDFPARVAQADETRAAAAELVDPDHRSAAEIVYTQLSGVTPTTLGTMVIARQHLEDAGGRRSSVTRVLDIRLRRSGGPWKLDRIVSAGGRPVRRPSDLPAAARRVLDDPRIFLPDSARWDIFRGSVDPALLAALSRVSQRHEIRVTALRTGHPFYVWNTDRPSAHAAGKAADLYAVGGETVLRQRKREGPAHAVALSLLAAGAAQVGSPWALATTAGRSFTDAVHQDHVHVQQSSR